MPAIERLGSKSSQNVEQNISTPNKNEPHVSINWLFFNLESKRIHPRLVKIPRALYEEESQGCQRIFSRLLRQEFEEDILFWKPKEPLLVASVVGEGWAQNIQNVEGICNPVFFYESLAEALDRSNRVAVHLIVTIERFRPSNEITEDPESTDKVGEFIDYRGYQEVVTTPGESPSIAAKPTYFRNAQRYPGQAIHDGRYPKESPLVTVAPPIQIFHPIFEQFVRYIAAPSEEPTDKLLKLTLDLMRNLSIIDESEQDRNSRIRTTLEEILDIQIGIEEEWSPDKSYGDGSYFISVNGISIPILIIEMKQEMGDGGCDPSTQAELAMRQEWCQSRSSAIRDKCCCPGFILAGGGPWMSVLGTVITNKYVAQRLTDLQWCALSSTLEDDRIFRIASMLNALRLCLRELRKYYEDISAAQDLELTCYDPHPRYFPYPTSFTNEEKNVIHFQYLQALEEDEPTCVTFLAQTQEKDIVVKFVSRYGVDVHKFLAAEGHAPNLLYYGPLSDAEPTPNRSRRPGLSLGPVQMVVMDYISSCKRIPFDAKQQLETILEKLHTEGYVFGDFRLQNIMFDEESKAKLIDFDWAGRYDTTILNDLPPSVQDKIRTYRESQEEDSGGNFVHYPLNISTGVLWAAGVTALGPIRPSHDWDMFDRLNLSH